MLIKPRKGFTLIELLVVVSIIALLVSILLPALGKARDQAKRTLCLTRMHQLGIGVEMYLQDHNDHYLPDQPPPPLWAWWYCIKDYIGGDPALMECPTFSYPLWGIEHWSYGWNIDVNYKQMVKVYPETVLIADGGWHWGSIGGGGVGAPWYWNVNAGQNENSLGQAMGGVYQTHEQGTNVLFADSRGVWFRYADLEDRYFTIAAD